MRPVRFQSSVFILPLALTLFPLVGEVRADSTETISAAATSGRRIAAAAATPTTPAPQFQWTPVLPPLPEGVTDLSFSQVMVTPVGPKGLDLSPTARQLVGKPVRLVGHMVRQMQPIPWTFLLSPVAQSLHEREYFLCDDLPANTVRVHVPKGPQPIVPYHPGLVAVTGTLTDQGPEESDGRSSLARLILAPGDTNGLVFVTAYARSERTNAPTATQFSAQNRREPQTDNKSKP